METMTNKKPRRARKKKKAPPLIAVKRGDRFKARPLGSGYARYIVIAGVSAHRTSRGDQPRVSWFETTRTGRRLQSPTRVVDGKRVRRAPDGTTFLTYDAERGQWVMPSRYQEVARA